MEVKDSTLTEFLTETKAKLKVFAAMFCFSQTFDITAMEEDVRQSLTTLQGRISAKSQISRSDSHLMKEISMYSILLMEIIKERVVHERSHTSLQKVVTANQTVD